MKSLNPEKVIPSEVELYFSSILVQNSELEILKPMQMKKSSNSQYYNSPFIDRSNFLKISQNCLSKVISYLHCGYESFRRFSLIIFHELEWIVSSQLSLVIIEFQLASRGSNFKVIMKSTWLTLELLSMFLRLNICLVHIAQFLQALSFRLAVFHHLSALE